MSSFWSLAVRQESVTSQRARLMTLSLVKFGSMALSNVSRLTFVPNVNLFQFDNGQLVTLIGGIDLHSIR